MATAIDATVAYLRGLSGVTALTSTRIAAKHRYGPGAADWKQPLAGIVVSSDGGQPPDLPLHDATIQLSCYGGSPEEALRVWEAVDTASRAVAAYRKTVTVGSTQCVMYFLAATSEPTLQFDEDVVMDVALGSFRALVSGTGLTV